jgi:surface-anchored protein
VWVDVNTHTHANWVFTEPGVYLAQIKLDAELVDGRTVSDTRELRFAVGTATSTDEAFAAKWTQQPAPAAAATPAGAAVDDSGGVSTGVLIAVGALILALAFAFVVARGRGAKHRARA